MCTFYTSAWLHLNWVKVDVVALDKQFVCCIKGTLDTLVLETQYGSTLLLIEQLSDLLSCQNCQIVKRLKSNSQDALCNRIKMTIGPLTAQVRIKHNVQCTQSGNPQRQVLVWLSLHLQVAERGESPLGGLHSLHTVCSPPPA